MPKPDIEHGQFIRVEKFAIKAPRGKQGGNNITKVAHEAVRTEGFCSHIEHPVPPRLLYGVNPLEAATRAEKWARQQTAQFLHKPSQTVKNRKYREDKPCALVGVISVPPQWTVGPQWTKFCEKSLAWLEDTYGKNRLCSVLEHRDETCLHLHFWVVPLAGESFSAIHPGEKALDEVGRKAARMIRDAVYKKAMSRFIDEFHQGIGRYFGLARETVGDKRRSREDWKRKKYHDAQRELDIQRRIGEAVIAAIDQLRLEQNNAQALKTESDLSLVQAGLKHNPARTDPNQNRAPHIVGTTQLSPQENDANIHTHGLPSQPQIYPVIAKLKASPGNSLVEPVQSMPHCNPTIWVRPRNGRG